MKTGIIVGRFQVPHLHIGHLHLITSALRECDEVKIILGVSNTMDERNPFTTTERVEMIHKLFPQIVVHLIQDNPSNEEWSKALDKVSSLFINPILYHSRDSFITSYTGELPSIEISEIEGYSGTKLREQNKI